MSETINENLITKDTSFCKEFTSYYDFYIKNPSNYVQDLLKASVTMIISSYNVINTPNGRKILIMGYIKIKFTNTSTEFCDEVITQKFSKKLTLIIPIDEASQIKKVSIKIIYSNIMIQHHFHVSISSVYIIKINSFITYYISDDDSWHKDSIWDSYSIKGTLERHHNYNSSCNFRNKHT